MVGEEAAIVHCPWPVHDTALWTVCRLEAICSVALEAICSMAAAAREGRAAVHLVEVGVGVGVGVGVEVGVEVEVRVSSQ